MDRWPHQAAGVQGVKDAIARGHRRIVLTSPTGGGKSKMVEDLLTWCREIDWRAVLYTNRRLLLAQLERNLQAAKFEFGVRAAGHWDQRDRPLQLSSLPTEASRVLDKGKWAVHRANLVLVDEFHLFSKGQAQEILRRHLDEGAVIVGVTATPVGLGDVADHLVVAGTTSELRKCGALLPCRHFAPDEPDLRHVGPVRIGEDLTEKQQDKAIMVPGVFGRVYDNWKRLNPMALPTVLFGPSVGGSVYLIEQFWRKGVPSAHIDAKLAWVNGKTYEVNDNVRADLLADSRAGRIAVLGNRFVLREGIDAPWLYHCIFACVFGSLSGYLQAGGRLLRNHDSLPGHVRVQDHGGNWWRHGSLNADRVWQLVCSNTSLAAQRAEWLRPRPNEQPRTCPLCTEVIAGRSCPCGWHAEARVTPRLVVQHDGELEEVTSLPFPKREARSYPDTLKHWKAMYFRAMASCKKGRPMSFRQALGLFARTHYYHPPDDLPLMPRYEVDKYRPVDQVPRERLYPDVGRTGPTPSLPARG